METKAQGQDVSPNDAKRVLPAVIRLQEINKKNELKEGYSLGDVMLLDKYINALSPNFTTQSSMKIFIDNYYSKDWLEWRFK